MPFNAPPDAAYVPGKVKTPTPVIEATMIAVAAKKLSFSLSGSPKRATDSCRIQDVTKQIKSLRGCPDVDLELDDGSTVYSKIVDKHVMC